MSKISKRSSRPQTFWSLCIRRIKTTVKLYTKSWSHGPKTNITTSWARPK